jgi:hypothetical protein
MATPRKSIFMSVELTARQRLVLTLSGDLMAGPWDQANKLWYLKGTVGDEWLEYAGEFTTSIETRLLDVALEDQLPADATGILVATEGWDYPEQLSASLRAKGESALKAYWGLYPPVDHPQRVSTRNMLLTCGDGEVIGLTTRQDNAEATAWAHLDGAESSPTGHETIDMTRAILGLFPALMDRLKNNGSHTRTVQAVLDAVDGAISGRLNEGEAMMAMLEALPDDRRAELFASMPEGLRHTLRSTLTDEQARRFGLD